MNRNTLVALLGAIIIGLTATGAAVAASTGPTVTVRIKTLTKTLRTASVRGQTGWITKDGTPKGKCPGDSAAGVLDAATHGKWAGKYYTSPSGILVTSILGVKPTGSDYWEILVNGKASSTGACGVKLRSHETILFKIAKS